MLQEVTFTWETMEGCHPGGPPSGDPSLTPQRPGQAGSLCGTRRQLGGGPLPKARVGAGGWRLALPRGGCDFLLGSQSPSASWTHFYSCLPPRTIQRLPTALRTSQGGDSALENIKGNNTHVLHSAGNLAQGGFLVNLSFLTVFAAFGEQPGYLALGILASLPGDSPRAGLR